MKGSFSLTNVNVSTENASRGRDEIPVFHCKKCYFVCHKGIGKCKNCGAVNTENPPTEADKQHYREWLATTGNAEGRSNAITRNSAESENVIHIYPSDEITRRSDAAQFYDGWVYNESLCEYHEVKTGHSIKKAAFDTRFNRSVDGGKSASQYVSEVIPTVAGTMFWPGQDVIFETSGLRYINTYRKHVIYKTHSEMRGGAAARERMIAHAHSLFSDPNDAEILLDWLAFVYQNPGDRVNWAVVVGGIEGNGKSYWKELMKRILGKNAGEVSGNTVKERFTDWAIDKQFIAIEEIMVSSRDKYDVVEKLKPFITNPTVDVEGKGIPSRTIPNFASYMLLTNHNDAIPFSSTDRRYCVLWTMHKTASDLPSQSYFSQLFADLDDYAWDLAQELSLRKISVDFNPKGRAPVTSGRAMMIEATRSGPEIAVEQAIEWVDNAIINERMVDLTQLSIDMQGVNHIDYPKSQRLIGKALEDLGYVKAGKMKVGAQRRNHYFWIAPQTGMTEEEARDALRKFH